MRALLVAALAAICALAAGGQQLEIKQPTSVSRSVDVTRAARDVRKEAVLDFQRRLRSINRLRIIGGQPATEGQFPWQVALISAGYQPQDGQFCGGSVIAPDWVVTAAHCVTGGTRAADVEVFIGSIDLRTGGQLHGVTSIFPHERFDSVTFDNDIALLRLSTPVAAGVVIGVVQPSEEPTLLPTGRNVRVSGWGRIAQGGPTSATLRFANVPTVDRVTCNHPDSYGGAITTNMLCAGLEQGGVDSCQGDSGGPLVTPSGMTFRLGGIVSWGDGCAEPKKYGVYTRIANYVSWIGSKMSPTQSTATPEWRTNVDWSIANTDAGASTDCPQQYPFPGCILGGGRACLMTEAIAAAKRDDCVAAVDLTLVTQCHNASAAHTIRAAASSVCEYLKTK
ncbi:MAG: serine protease [Acidobacteriota bacterium]|nr:serine protease [Acidobacteriota bacterium]